MTTEIFEKGKRVVLCEACRQKEATRDGGFIGPICGDRSCFRLAVQADEDYHEYYYGSSLYPDGPEREDKGK